MATAHLLVRIGKRTVALNNRLKLGHLATISKLEVLPALQHKLRLVVTGRLAGLPTGSTAVVVWLVHQAKRIIARHSAALQVKGKGEGFTSSWAVHLAKASGVSFSALVVVIALKGATEYSSVATSSLKFSVP